MSPGQQRTKGKANYLRIIGGEIVKTVEEGTPEAVLRKYELKDGTKGEKWEIHYQNWEGVIVNVSFKEGDYGEQCIIVFPDAVLTIPTNGRYFQDFACKVFNADLSKPVKLHPFDMEVEKGRKSGISVQQNGEKLKNFFYDYDTKKSLNGFPEVNKEKAVKKTYWKIYFTEVAEFLVEYIQNNLKVGVFAIAQTEAEPKEDLLPWEAEEKDEAKANDLAF